MRKIFIVVFLFITGCSVVEEVVIEVGEQE